MEGRAEQYTGCMGHCLISVGIPEERATQMWMISARQP